MNEKQKVIVFCDTKNKVVDEEYAAKLRQEFRNQTGWQVEKDTRIWKKLTEFSKGYSKDKRDVLEVCIIFRMANGLMNPESTK